MDTRERPVSARAPSGPWRQTRGSSPAGARSARRKPCRRAPRRSPPSSTTWPDAGGRPRCAATWPASTVSTASTAMTARSGARRCGARSRACDAAAQSAGNGWRSTIVRSFVCDGENRIGHAPLEAGVIHVLLEQRRVVLHQSNHHARECLVVFDAGVLLNGRNARRGLDPTGEGVCGRRSRGMGSSSTGLSRAALRAMP